MNIDINTNINKYIPFGNSIFFHCCVILAVLFIYIYLYRVIRPDKDIESFSQKEPFELKRNNDIYDESFIEMYDTLHQVEKRCSNELYQIIKITQPSSKSNILDIGSGTGYSVNELNDAGYKAYGLELSNKMIEYSNLLYPNIHIEKGDVTDSMLFDKSSFTHIMCTYFTIYNIQDKEKFFRNCYFWLQPNGYLILHLVDRKHMTQLIPHETHNDLKTTYSQKIIENNTVFNDFKYKGTIKIPTNEDNNKVELTETFTDNETENIRQNETTLYMEPIDTILEYASSNGFIFHAKINMQNMNNDSNQYLYFFERPL
tara:strand:- start:40 stop:984 length:945 start_codon:yes stop_codon:yes gene_type:complete